MPAGQTPRRPMHSADKFHVNGPKRAKILERGQNYEPPLFLTNIVSIFYYL